MSQSEIRLRLLGAGFIPTPCVGKTGTVKGWSKTLSVTPELIEYWGRSHPSATNTAVLTKFTPGLDIDLRDPDAAEAVERMAAQRFETIDAFIPIRIGQAPKRLGLFKLDGAPFKKITRVFGPPDAEEKDCERLEFLCDGQLVVTHGVHPDTKRPYEWPHGAPGDIRHADLIAVTGEQAAAFADDATRLLVERYGYRQRSKSKPSGNGANGNGEAGDYAGADWQALIRNIIDGKSLHDSLRDLAAKKVRSGASPGAVVNELRGLMEASTVPHDDRWKARFAEIPRLVESAGSLKPESLEGPQGPPTTIEPTQLDAVVKVFKKWLLLKDAWPVYVTLGAIAANHLPGPPVWLGLIAPPSSAKTELLNATLRLPKVELVTTASPAALLSGTPRKQMAKDAKGGLLRKVGSFGILVLKDFTSVLGLHRDNLSEMLDALREIYDGKWVRHLGTDGGRTLKWEGKLGLIFGCTEAYDANYATIGVLGDRFLLYRLPPSQHDQFEMAMLHTGERFKLMQDELAAAVAGLFAGLGDPLPAPRGLTDEESLRLKRKVILACCLRAGVDRDRHTRELEAVYGAEGSGRLGLALERLLAGLDVIGIDRAIALKIVEKAALDSVPPIRRKVYEELASGTKKTREVGAALGLPTTTVRRALEDITAHGLATRRRVKTEEGKDGRDDEWTRVELVVAAATLEGRPT
jgi:hypothetical protein